MDSSLPIEIEGLDCYEHELITFAERFLLGLSSDHAALGRLAIGDFSNPPR